MYEIKKIVPISLAKYTSLIAILFSLFSGLIHAIYYKDWKVALIDIVISIALYYVLFWIIGYIFALCYNLVAEKTKGILIDIKEEGDNLKEAKKDDKEPIDDEIKIENKFVV